MGHITSKSYKKLQKRLDYFAQGAPESESLFKILEILFSKEEAELVSVLPIKIFNIKKAAKIWKKSEPESEEILNTLADKGLLFDSEIKGERYFLLAPTMAGFFEFSLMRTDGKFDRKILSELFYQYLNEEEEFVPKLFGLNISIARTLVHEDMVSQEDRSEILDYEKASKVIDTASCITVGTCYCRHKMEHVGKACDQRQDVCLTFNNAAKTLSKHGVAKKISKEEAHEILSDCLKKGLVQVGDNVKNNVGWICNCCGCCCEALVGYKRTGYKDNFGSNFFAINNIEKCIGCGVCVKKCPVDSISMMDKKAVVDLGRCIGCGVCTRFCPSKSLTLKRKDELKYTPEDSFERCVLNAIETGKLQNYIFDNFDYWTHAMLRKMFGIIFAMPPVKRIAVSKQLRSKFLFALRKLRNTKRYKKLYSEGKEIAK